MEALKTGKLDGERITCEHCEKPATRLYLWYDIFSDDPKGIIGLCDEHDYYYGDPAEGYFTCEFCGRVFITNYTWENYYVITEDGRTLCLNCYLDEQLENEENWIRSVDEVTENMVRTAPHLIPVSSTYWKKHLEFVGNVEFDNLTGGKITGLSTSSTMQDGIDDLKEIVKEALKIAPKCMLILDAAYQFAVSIGVYIPKRKSKKTSENIAKTDQGSPC